jgi:hypothetical protein
MTDDWLFFPVTVGNTSAMMRLNLQSAYSVMWLTGGRNPFGLAQEPLPLNSQVYFGNQKIEQMVKLGSVKVGSLQINVSRMLGVNAEQGRNRSPNELPLAGEIGMDLFANVDFELDFKHKKLNLYSTDHCPGGVVYWSDTAASTPIKRGHLGNAFFPMELDGRILATTFSTGESTSGLPTDVTRRLYGFDEHSTDIETIARRDGGAVSSYRAMALSAPGLKVVNAKIILKPPSKCALSTGFSHNALVQYTDCWGAEPPLHLGLDVMSKLHLYFAMKENMLYFTGADDETNSKTASPIAIGQ